MKKVIFITSIFLVVMLFSCSKENIETAEQTIVLSEVEKQNILNSDSFLEIQRLNSELISDITTHLINNPELTKDIVNSDLSDDELMQKLNFNEKLYKYEQNISTNINTLFSENPILEKLDDKSIENIISDIPKKSTPSKFELDKTMRKLQLTTCIEDDEDYDMDDEEYDECQRKFERTMQHIHGQYDGAIMGALIGAGVGVLSLNPIPIIVGGFSSGWAVLRAIRRSAKAIDDYNRCVRRVILEECR